ncbi:MAG: Na+/H+ antiporter NhaA [Chitinophagaceae bacterium]
MNQSTIDQILKPVHKFIRLEYTGGIVLFISVIVALLWANSAYSASYHDFWEMKFSVQFAGQGLDQPLHIWINDGLMALFFFVIGLELKREFMAGELSTMRKASLPMMAALGGMIVPALIYLGINAGQSSARGWGIPMATDIAFALGILSLAGKNIPASVKVFLSALAVADDLGAVLVIAFFYTAHISMVPLIAGLAVFLLLGIGNLLGVRNTTFFLVLGLLVWFGFLLSGVHATIAGVLVAFTIPARTKINEKDYVRYIKKYTAAFEHAIPQLGSLTSSEQHHTIEKIKKISVDAETPLQKIEHKLHPWVAFVIMPLFALANAGIVFNGNFLASLKNPVSIGIIFGLIVGKFAGVLLFTWVMIRFNFAQLPQDATWKHIAGIAMLAGVGFTMSLFVTELAFDDLNFINSAKSGILLASGLAGLSGLIWLKRLK